MRSNVKRSLLFITKDLQETILFCSIKPLIRYISLMEKQFVVTQRYTVLQETGKR
jgi:hypothetical protein